MAVIWEALAAQAQMAAPGQLSPQSQVENQGASGDPRDKVETTEADTDDMISDLNNKALQGDTDAQYKLGLIYYQGNSVSIDPQEAEKWFRISADKGHAGSQLYLGLINLGPDPYPPFNQEALEWLAKSAEQGHEDAQLILDLIRSVEKTYQLHQRLLTLLQQGSEKGIVVAQIELARLLANGEFIEKDFKEAYFWSLVAEAKGGDSKSLIQEIEGELSEQEQNFTQVRAQLWLDQKEQGISSNQKSESYQQGMSPEDGR
jgi:TPR repeat protein